MVPVHAQKLVETFQEIQIGIEGESLGRIAAPDVHRPKHSIDNPEESRILVPAVFKAG